MFYKRSEFGFTGNGDRPVRLEKGSALGSDIGRGKHVPAGFTGCGRRSPKSLDWEVNMLGEQSIRARAWRVLGVLALGATAGVAQADQKVGLHRLQVDLDSSIAAAAHIPTQFAVPVSAAVGLSDGAWSAEGNEAVWRYAIQVSGSVSLSFHAGRIQLPEGASLIVQGGSGLSQSYRLSDVTTGGLWSRIFPGDQLSFTLRVPAQRQSQAQLSIDEIQSGFRSLGPGMPNAPAYERLLKAAAAQDPSTCVENYSCYADSSNADPAASTLALTVNNKFECSATLLMDTASDFRNLVLTARHCQGTDENTDASGVVFYFGARAVCGNALGSVMSDAVATSNGGTTRAENQDAWLIEMNQPVPANYRAYYAGWDATGASFIGGYGIHYDEIEDAQYSTFYGQAVAVPGSRIHGGILSSGTIWGLNFAGGTTLEGASGSGIWDPSNRIVGELEGGGDACAANPPAPPIPPGPNNSSGTYQVSATQLASVWQTNSTNDPTGNGLVGVLDAGKTGRMVVDGGYPSAQVAAPAVTLAASSTSASTGSMVTLTWAVTNAVSCQQAGGQPGDGWSRTISSGTGSQTVTSSTAATITYQLSCTNSNGTRNASASVSYSGPAAGGGANSGGGGSGGGAAPPISLLLLLPALLRRLRK